MSNKRYCEQCKQLNQRNGYCAEYNMMLAKERQTKEFVRCIDCIEQDYKELMARVTTKNHERGNI